MAYIPKVKNDASRLKSKTGLLHRTGGADITEVTKALADLADCVSDLADCVSDLDAKVERIKRG